MTAVTLIIPSDGRADMVLTRVSGAILYVPESQADAYRQHNPGIQIETHPDGAHRNLAAKRQDIYTRWGAVFMLDDDLAYNARVHLPGNNRLHDLTPDEAHDLIQRTAWQARAAGCYLYGFAATPNPLHYLPQRPIDLTGYINASAIGLWPSDRLYFSERTTAAESHWINLLNAYAHRKSWCDTRFHFGQKPGSTFTRPGGQTQHRTLASERADTLFLRRMFGQAVQVKRGVPTANKLHPYQRTLRLPL